MGNLEYKEKVVIPRRREYPTPGDNYCFTKSIIRHKKSPEPFGSGDNCSNIGCKSALGELGSTTGGLQTVLLGFLRLQTVGITEFWERCSA